MGNIEVGKELVVTRKITGKMIKQFCKMVRDQNPFHKNLAGARKLGFKDVVAPGMLTASFISGALWKLGGEGTLFGEISCLRFIKPVFKGERITIKLRVEARLSDVNQYGRYALLIIILNKERQDVILPTKAVIFVPLE